MGDGKIIELKFKIELKHDRGKLVNEKKIFTHKKIQCECEKKTFTNKKNALVPFE
jgi:hypothetical protein